MTKRRHFKARVRARRDKTGESYTSARANLLKSRPSQGEASNPWFWVAKRFMEALVSSGQSTREFLASSRVEFEQSVREDLEKQQADIEDLERSVAEAEEKKRTARTPLELSLAEIDSRMWSEMLGLRKASVKRLSELLANSKRRMEESQRELEESYRSLFGEGEEQR